MEDFPQKLRKNVSYKAKRAQRRKRNLLARELKMNKALHEKRIEPKRKREKFSVEEAMAQVAEDSEDRALDNADHTGGPDTDRREHRV